MNIILKIILLIPLLVGAAFADSFGVREFPEDQINMTGTGSLKIPLGSTAQRPVTPAAGMIRFNGTTGELEIYEGSVWTAPVGNTAFSDADFKVFNDVDVTKEAIFNLSNLTTATTRQYYLPDDTGIFALLEIDQTFSGLNTYTQDIIMTGVGQLKIPAGASAQRSSTPLAGMIRFNTDTIDAELYNGTAWAPLGSAAAVQGPGLSTDNAVMRWDGITGLLSQDSSVAIDDSGRISQTAISTSTIIGVSAGINDDLTANNLVAIGQEAANGNVVGLDVTAVGFQSAKKTTGNYNTAIGSQALENNTTSIGNVVVGDRALQGHNNSIGNNTAIGHYSQRVASSGNYNTSVGAEALENNITGDRNTVIGYKAGTRALSNDNVIIGAQAMGHESGGSFARNIIIGNKAGLLMTGTSTDNILIGDSVEASATTAVGDINIGNHIVGNIPAKLLGIGVTSPTVAMDIDGALKTTGNADITGDMTSKTLTTTGDVIVGGIGQIDVPSGTTAERSALPNSGMIRFNTDLTSFEGYNGATWGGLSPGSTPTTTEGDLILRGALVDERLGIGANGLVLTSDGTTASWQAASGATPTTTRGDIIRRGVAIDERLPIGTNGQVLTSDGTDVSWTTLNLSSTFQDSYNNSTAPQIVLDGVKNALVIQDNATPIAVPLFEVQSNGGATDYLSVSAGQVAATSTTISGKLEVASTADGSTPCPKMTTIERDALASPVKGQCIYNDTDSTWNTYDGAAWGAVSGASAITAQGDLIVGDLAGDETNIPIGANGLYLKSNGVTAIWDGLDGVIPLMAKGSLVTSNGVANGEFTACASGEILEWDPLQSSGIKCVENILTPTTTQGDIIVRGVAGDQRVPIGANNEVLTSDGTTAAWASAPVSTTLTTKGDIQTFSTVNAALAIGNDGEHLVADSTTATGQRWTDTLSGAFNPVTNSQDYAPTVFGYGSGSGTATGSWYRVGQFVHISVSVTKDGTNGTASSYVGFSLPSGLVRDTSVKLGVTSAYLSGSVNFTAEGEVLVDPINGLFARHHGTGNNVDGGDLTAGATFKIEAIVPIVGWSSGVNAVTQNKVLKYGKYFLGSNQTMPSLTATNIMFDTIFSGKEGGNLGADFNTSTGVYTHTGADACFIVSAGVIVDTLLDGKYAELGVYISPNEKVINRHVVGSAQMAKINVTSGKVCVASGETIVARALHSDAGNKSILASNNTFISIQEIADNNLIAAAIDSQKIVCEKKFLSANIVNANVSPIADLTYTVLSGREYLLRMNGRINNSSALSYDFENVQGHCFNKTPNTTGSQNFSKTCQLTTTGTTLSFATLNMNVGTELLGTGTNTGTYINLCLLPTNYVQN